MKLSKNLENKTPQDTCCRVQLICKKVPGFITTFLTILGVTEILCSFKLVLEGKTGKEISELSRLEFIEKFSANNFDFSDVECNTSGPLNRGGIADLPLLRTLLAIC